MKRFCSLAVLMLLSSSAHAGESFSFTVGGHRIHIEAPRHCRSTSCVSVSIPGVYETRRGRDRSDDRNDAADAAPAKPLAAAPAIVAPAKAASVQPAASCAPPSSVTVGSVAATTPQVTAPPPSNVAPSQTTTATSSVTAPAIPPLSAPVERPPVAAKAPDTAKLLKISREADEPAAQTPLGDWQTEGKTGSVRIQACGRALCGYIINASSNAVGETVLVNMKPKASAEWSGNIYSRDSGNTYYATMTMKGPNALRVEACALGRFFCSGNIWSRINAAPDRMISSSQPSSAPRS